MTERRQTQFTENIDNQKYVIYIGFGAASLCILYVYRFHLATIVLSYGLGCLACYFGLKSSFLHTYLDKLKSTFVKKSLEGDLDDVLSKGCLTCGSKDCLRHDGGAQAEPWVGLQVHKQLDQAIEEPVSVALVLLRSCLAMPKLTYAVRTAPVWRFPDESRAFDSLLKQILECILNVELSSSQWAQASLPIRHGGLGIRSVEGTSLAAFLASSHGVKNLVTRILSEHGDEFQIPFVEEALQTWTILCPLSNPPARPDTQRSWDDIQCKVALKKLEDSVSGAHLARVKAAAKPESDAWLHALPSPVLGTLLDNDTLRVAVALRLGCDVCEPHRCICGVGVEANGHHGLSCGRCAGRFPRHHALNDLIRRALISANIPCVLEPPGLSRTDGKRPDGLTLVPWERGKSLLWDATCVSTFAASHVGSTKRIAGSAAESAATAKHAKYSMLSKTYIFVPFAVETTGVWGFEAKQFLSSLSRRLRERGQDRRSGSYLAQRISLAIQRGNAASIMGTFEPGTIRGGLFD
ncbi:unnamed protein product [Plutella xylostella]|uniref:(diamondback moth) hypothetical protein n=1 Tax=Plutella xylostella TaxID=51655 RepID=A0A8S4CX53_PLUXY|nr:unnamed protein product [Plutella xylostella]